MIPWTRAEMRWRDALFAAMIPPIDAGIKGLGAMDLSRFWHAVGRSAPPLARLGLRGAVWMLTFSPLFLVGAPRLFAHLDSRRQDTLLRRAGQSRFYLVRQMVLTIKAFACFAVFSDGETRALVHGGGGRP